MIMLVFGVCIFIYNDETDVMALTFFSWLRTTVVARKKDPLKAVFFTNTPRKTNMTGWNIHRLKMYFLLNHGNFPACYVSFHRPKPGWESDGNQSFSLSDFSRGASLSLPPKKSKNFIGKLSFLVDRWIDTFPAGIFWWIVPSSPNHPFSCVKSLLVLGTLKAPERNLTVILPGDEYHWNPSGLYWLRLGHRSEQLRHVAGSRGACCLEIIVGVYDHWKGKTNSKMVAMTCRVYIYL